MQALTISQLEEATGVNRSTVYYYISEGLLPPAQKSSATRAVYDQSHVELLGEIERLKSGGFSLKAIREAVADRVREARESGVDLVALQSEDTRTSILRAAARRFAERGYARTRISDICKEVGVTAQLLYSHFPSKKHLFIECYTVYFEWMHDQVEPAVQGTTDIAERVAWRSWASLSIQAFSPDLQALARVEAFQSDSDLRPLVRELYDRILAGAVEELRAHRSEEVDPGLFNDELVAYAFLGALENMEMRASWDDKFSKRDIMRTLVAMYLSVWAAYDGRLDLAADWRRVASLVDKLAAEMPDAVAIMGDDGPAG